MLYRPVDLVLLPEEKPALWSRLWATLAGGIAAFGRSAADERTLDTLRPAELQELGLRRERGFDYPSLR